MMNYLIQIMNRSHVVVNVCEFARSLDRQRQAAVGVSRVIQNLFRRVVFALQHRLINRTHSHPMWNRYVFIRDPVRRPSIEDVIKRFSYTKKKVRSSQSPLSSPLCRHHHAHRTRLHTMTTTS
jgi:hypothetical protein